MAPAIPTLSSVSMNSTLLGTSQEWNHTVFVLPCVPPRDSNAQKCEPRLPSRPNIPGAPVSPGNPEMLEGGVMPGNP